MFVDLFRRRTPLVEQNVSPQSVTSPLDSLSHSGSEACVACGLAEGCDTNESSLVAAKFFEHPEGLLKFLKTLRTPEELADITAKLTRQKEASTTESFD